MYSSNFENSVVILLLLIFLILLFLCWMIGTGLRFSKQKIDKWERKAENLEYQVRQAYQGDWGTKIAEFLKRPTC